MVGALVRLVWLAAPGLAMSCRDEDGNPVDWWIMYKLPKQVGGTVT